MAFPKHPHANTHWLSISTTAPSASVIILVPNGSQFAVPRKPREERHDHTRQRRRKPGQCADDHGYAEQNFAYANEHGQRQRPFRQSRKVQGPGFKVLFEFVHEAQGIVALMSPDTMKSDPTKRRQILMMVFHMDMNYFHSN